MPRKDPPSTIQAPIAPGHSADWPLMPYHPGSSQQSNALAGSAGWLQFFGPTAALSGEDPGTMAGVGDFNYAQRFNGLNLNGFVPAEHPGVGQGGDYSQDFATYMPPVHSHVMEKLDSIPINNQASPLLGIDPNGPYPSFDGGDPATQSIESPPSSNNGWTKEQDKLLMSLKAQGLGYSAIQDEMRKQFGWTRNKNVLVKRFAVLKKRCKPQIKTRVSRNYLTTSIAISH